MRYLIFAEVAEKEGKPNLARLFRAIAYAEQVHATNHYRELGMIRESPKNLEVAIAGETYEVEEMYPAYLSVAELQKEQGRSAPSTTLSRPKRSTPRCTSARKKRRRKERIWSWVRCTSAQFAGTPWRERPPTTVPSAGPQRKNSRRSERRRECRKEGFRLSVIRLRSFGPKLPTAPSSSPRTLGANG
jgi:rubrerythrin